MPGTQAWGGHVRRLYPDRVTPRGTTGRPATPARQPASGRGRTVPRRRFGARFSSQAALGAAVLVAATACSAETSGTTEASHRPSASSGDAPVEVGHVHGLGVDPESGDVYAASHFGVFRLRDDGSASRVANRWQDTMAFTVVGPGHFLGSGHPDVGENLPAHLGLIESRDGARTWQALSLQGEADFHALQVVDDDGHLVGYDSLSRRLLQTFDGRSWDTVDTVDVVDLAAAPASEAGPRHADVVLATTATGEVLSYTLSGRTAAKSSVSGPQRVVAAPPLVFVDWPSADQVVGVGPDGSMYLAPGLAGSWQRVEGPPGDPQALTALPGRWLMATSAGIFSSTDQGRTWQDLVEPAA